MVGISAQRIVGRVVHKEKDIHRGRGGWVKVWAQEVEKNDDRKKKTRKKEKRLVKL